MQPKAIENNVTLLLTHLAMELLFGKTKNARKTILLVSLPLLLLGLIPFHHKLSAKEAQTVSRIASNESLTIPAYHREDVPIKVEELEKCDVYTGEWIRNPEAPYYTNKTCWAIHEHQNCMKYGRPDLDFIEWRWKPDGCDLPIFNPFQFLDIVRGKSLAFVGDSIGRNQMQSLICMLSRVEYPYDESYSTDENFKRWKYRGYNFTLATFWSPLLVKVKGATHTGLSNVHLDEFDDNWVTQIEEFDYVIINGGHWFYSPSIYYENGGIVGCRFCQVDNITDFPMTYGYRKALRTAFEAINRLEKYKGLTILRTYTPPHFEGGEWNKGGDCVRTKPFRSNETMLEGPSLDLYLTQVEEFKVAQRQGRKKGLRYRLLDTTQAMMLRPDGHPSRYGHWPNQNVTLYNDCVHWCLPGPIDTWSDFLLDMLKREGRRSRDERLQFEQETKQSN